MELMINHFLFINAHQSGSLVVFFEFLDHLQWCSVCDPAKIFFTSMFTYLLFGNPTLKTEIGTAYRCRTQVGTRDQCWVTLGHPRPQIQGEMGQVQ
jgi:hypothetical protein